MYNKDSKNKTIDDDPAIAASALSDLLGRCGFNSPDLFVQQIDPGSRTAAVLRMSRAAYRAASFLDSRVLPLTTDGFVLPHDHLVAWTRAITEPPAPVHFIFHAGHVGSTLLSRLIEEACGVLSLREPATLRTLASMHDALSSSPSSQAFDTALATQVRLWRRGYRDTTSIVVKATSDTARIGERLMREAPEAKAILLNAGAEVCLAQTLSSPMRDLEAKGPERFKRLSHLLGAPTPPVASHGQAAAMSWLAESMTQKRIAEACATRILSLDFDAFLADPDLYLRAVFQHLSVAAPAALRNGARGHVLMGRYSKDPAKAYSALDRAERLKASRQDNAEEIRRGLAWLDCVAEAHPAAAAALAA